jgi:transcription termination factor Rho
MIEDIIAQQDAIEEDDEENNQNTYVIKSSTNTAKQQDYSRTDLSVYNFRLAQNPPEYSDEIMYTFAEGYLQILPEGYGILRGDDLITHEKGEVYVTAPIIKKYNLQNGVCIGGKARKLIENKPYIMYVLETCEALRYPNRKHFEEYSYNGIGEEFFFDRHNIKMRKGERIYIRNASLDKLLDLCKHLLVENGVKMKFINITSMPEEHIKPDQKLQVVSCKFNMDPKEVLNAVELTIDRLKREIEFESSTILVIYNFSELLRLVNVAINGYYDFSKIDASAIGKIHNILSLAKFVSSRLNSTVLCVDKNDIPEDIKGIMTTEIIPVFNNIIDQIN